MSSIRFIFRILRRSVLQMSKEIKAGSLYNPQLVSKLRTDL